MTAHRLTWTDERSHTVKELVSLCEEWQGYLRMVDWCVEVRLTPQSELQSHTAMGECEIKRQLKQALIKIVTKEEYLRDGQKFCPQTYDAELTLVHELLHIQFDCVSPYNKKSFDPRSLRVAEFESAIELTAQALVVLKRSGEKPKMEDFARALDGHGLPATISE